MKGYAVLFALWLVVFSVSSQVLIFAPILPRIAEELRVEAGLLGTLITVYALAVGVFALVAGPVSDRIGRRRILLAGSVLMVIALGLHAFVESFTGLFAVRVLAGIAGGVLNGASIAYVSDYFPRERRGWASGWVLSGFAAGQIAGIPLGTILADAFGFRAPFVAFTAVIGFAAVLVWQFVPQVDIELAAAPLNVRTAVGEYIELLGRPGVTVALASVALAFLGFASYVAYLPLWLETTLDASGTSIALLFLFGGVAAVLAGPWAGGLSDRRGRKLPIVGASVIVAGVVLATPFVAGSLLIVSVLFALAMGLFAAQSSPLNALLTELASESRRGSLLSLTAAAEQIGVGIGAGLAGVLYTDSGYIPGALVAAAACLLVAVVIQRWPPKDDSRTDSEGVRFRAEGVNSNG